METYEALPYPSFFNILPEAGKGNREVRVTNAWNRQTASSTRPFLFISKDILPGWDQHLEQRQLSEVEYKQDWGGRKRSPSHLPLLLPDCQSRPKPWRHLGFLYCYSCMQYFYLRLLEKNLWTLPHLTCPEQYPPWKAESCNVLPAINMMNLMFN